MSGTGDQPMSRRKSFKKSLRESFRRLRKGRSQRPSTSGPKSIPTSPISKPEDQSSNNAGPSISAEVRPVERQIEARNVDDGMGSMVRCLLMVKTFVISQSAHASATVWAGTNSGAIYVFSLGVPAGVNHFQPLFFFFSYIFKIDLYSCVSNLLRILGNRRQTEPVSAQLAKEIQLKHRAPVVSINIIDASFASIGDLGENVGTSISDSCPPHRVVISSEEQFKVITISKTSNTLRLKYFFKGFYTS